MLVRSSASCSTALNHYKDTYAHTFWWFACVFFHKIKKTATGVGGGGFGSWKLVGRATIRPRKPHREPRALGIRSQGQNVRGNAQKMHGKCPPKPQNRFLRSRTPFFLFIAAGVWCWYGGFLRGGTFKNGGGQTAIKDAPNFHGSDLP